MVPDVSEYWSDNPNAMMEYAPLITQLPSVDGRRFVLFVTKAQADLWRNENAIFRLGNDHTREIYGDAFIFAIRDPSPKITATGVKVYKWRDRRYSRYYRR